MSVFVKRMFRKGAGGAAGAGPGGGSNSAPWDMDPMEDGGATNTTITATAEDERDIQRITSMIAPPPSPPRRRTNSSRGKGGGGGLAKLFRRHKSDSSISMLKKKRTLPKSQSLSPEHHDTHAQSEQQQQSLPQHRLPHSSRSRAFSERTHSTMSLSQTSRGGGGLIDDVGSSLRFSVVRASNGTTAAAAAAASFAKSDFLQDMSFQDLLENSEECRATEDAESTELAHQHPQRQEHDYQHNQEEDLDMEPISTATSSKLLHGDPQVTSASTATRPCYVLQKNEFPELGYLKFAFTDIPNARKHALTTTPQKPLLVVYAEVPGDEDMGKELFSHPLFVEAIHTMFIPVLCVQTVTPATPVRRLTSGRRCRTTIKLMDVTTTATSPVKAEQEDEEEDYQWYASLYGDNLSRKSLAQAMIDVLLHLRTPIPQYLEMLHQGEVTNGVESRNFVFGTQQPVQGEVEFATEQGVVSVQSALLCGRSICIVTYDPRRTSYSSLLRTALNHTGLCDSVYHRNNEERVAGQIEMSRFSAPSCNIVRLALEDNFLETIQEDTVNSKQPLRATPMRYVPLVELQSCRANRLISLGRFNEAMHILSPFQGTILMNAMRYAVTKGTFFDLVNVPIDLAWESVCEEKPPSQLSVAHASTTAGGNTVIECETNEDDL